MYYYLYHYTENFIDKHKFLEHHTAHDGRHTLRTELEKLNIKQVIINSIIGQLQAQRDSGGAIISHWTISEIENILIPLLDLKTQRKIEAKVKQSFELRDKSKELLENAKVKIENAIIDS